MDTDMPPLVFRIPGILWQLRRIWNSPGQVQIVSVIKLDFDDDHYKDLLDNMRINFGRQKFNVQGSFYVPYCPYKASYDKITLQITGQRFHPAHADGWLFGITDSITVRYPEDLKLSGVLEFRPLITASSWCEQCYPHARYSSH